MLATNRIMYEEVLSFSKAQGDDGINWANVFEDASLYKQIYKQEIITAVLEDNKLENINKRVIFVSESVASSTMYGSGNVIGGQSGGAANLYDTDDEQEEEEKKDSSVASKLSGMPKFESEVVGETSANETEEQRTERLKTEWINKFLESDGFSFALNAFLSKEVSSADAVSFSEQTRMKDQAFLMTLLRVFFQAGFSAQSGGIGDAIGLVRKSSSINDESELQRQKKEVKGDPILNKMKSPEGIDVMLNTNFDQIFDKLLELLAVMLSKTNMILEDKVIIENALSLLVGTLLYKKDCYAKFVNFQSTKSQTVRNIEELILAGIFCSEEKVRTDFGSSLNVLSVNLREADQNALSFFLRILARNFNSIGNRPSRQFFELFTRMIDLKAYRDELMGSANADERAIYDPEDLLNQIIDKIKAQQKMKKEAADDGEDEVKAQELAAEQERLVTGLISLTGKIITKADKVVSDRII